MGPLVRIILVLILLSWGVDVATDSLFHLLTTGEGLIYLIIPFGLWLLIAAIVLILERKQKKKSPVSQTKKVHDEAGS